MQIILKYILNNVREQLLRTMVMLLSIVLSTTLLLVSLSIGASYESAQRKMAQGFAGTATIAVSQKPEASGQLAWISAAEIPRLASIGHSVGLLTTTALYHQAEHFENFDLLAADLNELNTLNPPRLLGAATLSDFSGYRIVAPEKFTTKYGLKPGDALELAIDGTDYTFKLAAIAAYDTVFLRQTRGINALLPKETLAEILKASKGNSRILIEPAQGVTTDNLIRELASALSPERYVVTMIYNQAQVASEARQKSLPCYLISFFSLIMSVFIIFSSYQVITLERLPAIGTFRSIGATERATTNILLLESLLYGLSGGLLGIPLGHVALKLLLDGLGQSLSFGIEIPRVVSPLNIGLAWLVAIGVSLLSAYIPIYRASRLPVKDVVLGTVEEKQTSNKALLGLGLALFILSLILPRLGGAKASNLLMAAGGFSLLGLIAAIIIVIPLITNGMSIVLEQIYAKTLGNEGKLAARNLRHNKNINQNVTLLFISLSAVIVISLVIRFAGTYVTGIFKGGALDGFASGDMDAGFVDKVKSLAGVDQVLAIYELSGNISANQAPFRQMEAVDDLALLNGMLNINYADGATQRNFERVFDKNRNILLSRDCLEQRQLNVGDTLSLSYENKVYEYTILGSFRSRADSSEAILPAAYARRDFGAVNYGKLTYSAADPEAVMVQIRTLFGNRFNWSRTIAEFETDFLGVVNAFLEPMRNLTYFILLLAVIGVVNNLIINYLQKRRAIALYKAVGLSNRQNIKMSIIEGFSAGLIGAVIGLGVAYLEIGNIFLVAGPRLPVKPEIEGWVFMAAGLAGILITLTGSVVPILKGSTLKLVDALKLE